MGTFSQWHRSWLMAAGVLLLVVACATAEEGTEVERLRRQVKYLGDALAVAKAETDVLKARLDGRAYEAVKHPDGLPPGMAVREKEYRILGVNEELGMVILDGGRQDGLKPGLLFAVIDQGRSMTKVRIVDVRTAVAGAVIQEMGVGFPKVHDRAVLVTGSRN